MPDLGFRASCADARCLISGFGLLVLSIGLCRSPELAPVLLLASGGILLVSSSPLRSLLLRRLKAPAILAALVWLLLALFSREGPELTIGPITLASTGFWQGALLFPKVLSIVAAVSVLIDISGFLELARALRSLGAPSLLVDMGVLAARYTHVLGADLHRMRIARRLRGYRGRPLPWMILPVESRLVGTLLVRSEERASRVHRAMKVRGYSAAKPAVAGPRAAGSCRVLFLMGGLSIALFATDLALRGAI